MPNYGGPLGGYNGGGPDIADVGDSSFGGGGGATDIRLIGGKWNDTESLLSRFIVAGGSGGSHEPPWGRGGNGGGIPGLDAAKEGYTAGSYATYFAKGGTINEGEKVGSTCRRTPGDFGKGGQGWDGGGGGGGWYGVGGGCLGIGGGGGSGFVLNESTKIFVPENYKVSRDFYLDNALSIPGNQNFLNPNGSEETGHIGNGYCTITLQHSFEYINSCIRNIYLGNFMHIYTFIFLILDEK